MTLKRFRENWLNANQQDLIRELIPEAKKGMVFYSRPFDGTTERWIKRTILGNGLYHVEDLAVGLDDVNLISSYINSFKNTTKSQLPGSLKFLNINQTLKILHNLLNRS